MKSPVLFIKVARKTCFIKEAPVVMEGHSLGILVPSLERIMGCSLQNHLQSPLAIEFHPEEVPSENAMNYDRSPPGSAEVKVTPTVKFVLELVGLDGTLVCTPKKKARKYAKNPDSIFVHTFRLPTSVFQTIPSE